MRKRTLVRQGLCQTEGCGDVIVIHFCNRNGPFFAPVYFQRPCRNSAQERSETHLALTSKQMTGAPARRSKTQDLKTSKKLFELTLNLHKWLGGHWQGQLTHASPPTDRLQNPGPVLLSPTHRLASRTFSTSSIRISHVTPLSYPSISSNFAAHNLLVYFYLMMMPQTPDKTRAHGKTWRWSNDRKLFIKDFSPRTIPSKRGEKCSVEKRASLWKC